MKIIKPLFQVLFVLMLLLSEASAFITPVEADTTPVVEENTVRISGTDAYIEATPSTLTASGWVEVTFWTRNYEGAVDVVYGFNGLDNVKAVNPQVWESYVHNKTRQVPAVLTATFKPDKVVSENKAAIKPTKADTDLSLNSQYTEITYEANSPMSGKTTQQTMKLAYDSYDSKTGAYSYKYNGTVAENYTETYVDWNVKSQPTSDSLSYAGANQWNTAPYKSVIKNEVQKTRVWIDIPFGGINTVSGKYNIGIKPSSLTLQQAKDQGKLWLLDPWYSASWLYRKQLTVYGSSAGVQTNYQKLIRVYKADAGADMPENLAQYTTGDDGVTSEIRTATWRGQSFVAEATATVKKVWLKIIKVGTPGATYTCSITAIAAGVPNKADIKCSGTITGNYVSTTEDWYEFDMGAGAALTSGTSYGIILYSAGGSAGNALEWRSNSAGAYTGGTAFTTPDSGVNWTAVPAVDYMFQVITSTTGTVPLRVDTEAHCLASFADLRFTKADGTTLLDYWIENSATCAADGYADCWVELDTIAQMTSLTEHTHYYIYYGNAGAAAPDTDTNMITNTMIFGDSFNRADSATVGNGWTESEAGGSTCAISSNTLLITYVAGAVGVIKATSGLTDKLLWRLKSRVSAATVGALPGLSPQTANRGQYFFYAGDSNIYCNNLGSATTGYAYANNVYDTFTALYDNTNNKWDLIGNDSSFRLWTLVSNNASAANIVSLSPSAAGTFQVDYVFIAKFAKPVPLWGTAGAEEGVPTCALTGTAQPDCTESEVIAGGQTIILTLTNDTWVATGATFDAQRTNIIAGLTSAGAEAHGWNVEVKAILQANLGSVVRTNNTVVTITLPACAAYAVTAQETITVTVPSTAINMAIAIVAAPTFNVVLVAPTVTTGLCTGFGTNWAILNGNITSAGYPVTCTSRGFNYGLTGAYGSTSTTSGTYGTGAYSQVITGLAPATTYHYSAFATGLGGTGTGVDATFTTSGAVTCHTVFETATTADDDVYGINWVGQSFTTPAGMPYTVKHVSVNCVKVGAPTGTVTLGIYRATSGVPYGQVLTSGTFSMALVPTATNSWYGCDVTEISLEPNTQYALVASLPDGTAAAYLQWNNVTLGGYTGGNGSLSANSGTDWAIVAHDHDMLFRICGNPVLQIQDVKVFQTYRQTNDWLVTVRYVNLYPPYYDTYDVKKYFTLQLVDSTATVKASSPCPAWGNRVGNIYLSAATTTPLTYGGDYKVRIYGTFTGNPYVEYAIQSTDWMGDDLVNLDSWVITSASVIGTYYTTSMTTYIAERGEVLNSTGSGVFSLGIAGLSTVRPTIFQTYTTPSTYTPGTITQSGRTSIPAWQTNVGPDATVMLTRVGNIVGIGGDIIAIIAFLIMMFILMALAFPAGNTTAAMVLSLPMLGAAIWFGMDLLYIGMIALISAFLFIKNFWLDKGN